MTKRNLTTEQIREIAESLAASNGDRRDVIEQWSRVHGCSAQQVYAWARAGGWSSGRKTRSDAGSRRSTVCPDAIEKAALIKFRSTTNKYDSPMAAEDAIDVAGVASLGVQPHHVNNWLRKMQLDRSSAQKAVPRVTRSTSRPNEEHQFDTSPCAFQLKKKDRLAWNPRHGRDDGKQPTGKPIIRFVLTDHFTGFIYFQYQCAFESFEASAKFLHEAWTRKSDPQMIPFCGVPDTLYLDQGPTFKSGHVKVLCENLDIELRGKQPSGVRSRSGKLGSAAALGSVERAHPIIETKFESRIRLQRPKSLEELNEWAYLWCIEFNGLKKHSRHGMTRSALWSTIRSDELRIPPEDLDVFMAMAERPTECHIYGDLTIRFKGRRYEIDGIPVDMRGTKAAVMYSPYSFPDVRVLGKDGAWYNARPLAQASGLVGGWYEYAVQSGEFRSFKDTTTERSQKAAEAHDIGKVEAFPDFAERLANVRFMSRAGEQIQPDTAPTKLSMYHALEQIREAIGRKITIEENADLRRRYGDWMTDTQIEEEIATKLQRKQKTDIHEGHEGGA